MCCALSSRLSQGQTSITNHMTHVNNLNSNEHNNKIMMRNWSPLSSEISVWAKLQFKGNRGHIWQHSQKTRLPLKFLGRKFGNRNKNENAMAWSSSSFLIHLILGSLPSFATISSASNCPEVDERADALLCIYHDSKCLDSQQTEVWHLIEYHLTCIPGTSSNTPVRRI